MVERSTNRRGLFRVERKTLASTWRGRETDSLQTALDKMLNYEEDIIPVLDSEGNILGDLRLSINPINRISHNINSNMWELHD